MLRTAGLTKRFGGLVAVDDVDFELGDELCSLIGPNGAGKTTFFDLLTGVREPSAGTIEFRRDGEWVDVTHADPAETAAMGVHRSYQVTNVFPTSSVMENVRVAAQAHATATPPWASGPLAPVAERASQAAADAGLPVERVPSFPSSAAFWRNVDAFEEVEAEAAAILDRVGLTDRADVPAQSLSHGERRKLEVAIALAGDPDALLLDEPNAGVSSESVDEVVALIEDVAEDHAVLLVEHNMDIVMEVSDRIVVLHQGAIIADGTPTEVRGDPDVQEAYLGGYGADDSADETGAGGVA